MLHTLYYHKRDATHIVVVPKIVIKQNIIQDT